MIRYISRYEKKKNKNISGIIFLSKLKNEIKCGGEINDQRNIFNIIDTHFYKKTKFPSLKLLSCRLFILIPEK